MNDMRRLVIITLICIAVLVGVLLLAWPGDAKTTPTLLVHAGAGIQLPLNELGKLFEQKTGVRVQYSFKGSGCLLPDIVISEKGDLYIPGELFYMQQAVDRGLISKYRLVAQMSTVMIAQQGNPKAIRTVKDLGRPGLRIGLADAKAVAIGRAAEAVLKRAGCLQAVRKNVVMSCMNVVELGNATKLGHLDGAIVWDACAALYQGAIATVPIPASYRETSTIPVGVIKSSQHPKEAAQFMDFLATREAAQVFRKHGYGVPTSGDKGKKG